jgi:hypothetical protein
MTGDSRQPHSDAFLTLVRTAYLGEDSLRAAGPLVENLMKVTNDELVLLAQLRPEAKMSVYQEAVAAEVARRTIEAGGRLATLTRWLIGFTVAVVSLTLVLSFLTLVVAVLTGIVAWHDLTH